MLALNKKKKKSWFKYLFGFLISFACFGWILKTVNVEEVLSSIKSANYSLIALAVIITFFSYLLRAWRWPFFFEKSAPKFLASFRCLILGFFFNNIFPARLGEFGRAFLGAKATGLNKSTVLATIAGERLFDGLTISLLFATLFHFSSKGAVAHSNGLYYVAIMFLAIALGTVLVLSQRRIVFKILDVLSKMLPGKFSGYTMERIRRFINGLAPMFKPRALCLLAGSSFLVWSVELLVYYLVTKAFHLDLGIKEIVLFLTVVNFSSLIPSAPAGVGVIEVVATETLEGVGVVRSLALAMVVTQHLIQFLVVGIPGSFLFFSKMSGKIPEEDFSDDQTAEVVPTKDSAVQETALPDISVVFPAYNEELRLANTVNQSVKYLEKRKLNYEIIVVDDGSKDQTAEVVIGLSKENPRIHLLTYPLNRGKGYAVKFGVLNSKGKLILFADADGATPIVELERLENALAEGYDIAIGSRALNSSDTKVIAAWHRKLLGRIYNLFVNLVILPKIKDTQCGFKLFKQGVAREVFSKQKAEKFSFDVEILFIAKKAGYKIIEIPVNWSNVPGSKVKLGWDSLLMGRDILKFRLYDIFGAYN